MDDTIVVVGIEDGSSVADTVSVTLKKYSGFSDNLTQTILQPNQSSSGYSQKQTFSHRSPLRQLLSV